MASKSLSDLEWDAFLRENGGEFQQCSAWAEAKRFDGWNSFRVVLAGSDNSVLAGAQILVKRKGLWRIGYIPKGPLVGRGEDPIATSGFRSLLGKTLWDLGLMVCVAQGASTRDASLLDQADFLPFPKLPIIDTTLVVNTSVAFEQIVRGIRSQCLSRVRRAAISGVSTCLGSIEDLPRFFHLMIESCRRQKSVPSPRTLDAFTALFQAFHKIGAASLHFVSVAGSVVAGALCVTFANRMTFFKVGWDGRYRQFEPLKYLIYSLLEQCSLSKITEFDFAGLDGKLASAIDERRSFTADELKARDFYKTHFGGFPRRYPVPRVWGRNPAIRILLRVANRVPK